MVQYGEDVDILYWGFHLFQRVVGFRLPSTVRCFEGMSGWFPSLSESSGFPTSHVSISIAQRIQLSFHLFQRVVGFRRVETGNTPVTLVNQFPSLSESSGFPTHKIFLKRYLMSFHVSISFREQWVSDLISHIDSSSLPMTKFPSLSESSGFPTRYKHTQKVYWIQRFPSLSESSGFPTSIQVVNRLQ